MNYVESIEIIGFWGRKNVLLEFNHDLNFVIGPNGSGKTTIINLLASALQADIATLYSVPFDEIVIKLKTIGSNVKPVINIKKHLDESTNSFELTYTVREKATEKGVQFVVEGPYDERVYLDPRRLRNKRMYEVGARLSSIIGSMVEINWLSIHRASINRFTRASREESYDNTIEQKIAEISQKFSSYFSLLSSKANDESKIFQEYIFLSLLTPINIEKLNFGDLPDSAEDRDAVIEVLKDLGVSDKKSKNSVKSHFSRIKGAQKRFVHSENEALNLEDFILIMDSTRIRGMISKWYELNQKRNEIYKPKILFENLINNLLNEKELHFNERNEPNIHLSSGQQVGIDVLSSGEKQLFILLGEALLQENKPVVFISDEPELSLHVKWQRALFDNIRMLNGSCQVITATHSPDIVGPFQDRIILIEECMADV